MAARYPIWRKPVRRYPLPTNIRELDEPHAECVRLRYARVDRFKDGHDPDEDPTRYVRERKRTVVDEM